MNFKKATNLIKDYSKNWRRNGLIVLFALLLVVGGIYWYSRNQAAYVPQDFYAARDRAAAISTRIDQLTEASVVTLGQISSADASGQYGRGLELVNQEIDRNAAIKEQAGALSEELKVMALNLNAVKPKKAAETGLQAATTGLELTQHLINYNNLSQELLAALQMRLKKNGDPQTRQRIEQIILRMNEEAETINKLNEKYQEEMRQFEKLTS